MQEQLRLQKIELLAQTHADDCVQWRRSTDRRFDTLEAKIDTGFVQTADAQRQQHQQNLGSLRWQRGILITILLAILSYVGEQLATKLIH